MSDAARQNLKVSREGIVLIKSFEGFRPRAIQRAEGGWIIGYGHTLSAREGATVSEADAELLLRYDLLPVEASVNDTVPTELNQHQFDALVSFAFSVGVDRFAGSDVRQRLAAGAPGEAADAIMGWPEPVLPETALRRRAAERALFVANPGAPVALSDLLSAPLPPPPVPVQEPRAEPIVEVEPEPVASEAVEAEGVVAGPMEAEPVGAESVEVEPVAPEPVEADSVVAEPAAVTDAAGAVDPRGAAVAALLGEPAARLVQEEAAPAPIIPSFAPPAPANDDPPVEDVVVVEAEPEQVVIAPEPATEPAVDDIVDAEPAAEVSRPEEPQDAPPSPVETVETVQDATPASDDTDETPPIDAVSTEESRVEETTAEQPTDIDASEGPVLTPTAAWSASRYAPYSLSMVGPLPYLPTATKRVESDSAAIDHSVVEGAPVEVEHTSAGVEATAFADEPTEVIAAEVSTEALEPEAIAPTVEASLAAVDQPSPDASISLADTEPAPIEAMAHVAPTVAAAPVADLVLTPLEDAPEPAFARPLWTAEERDASDGSENNLFGEDLTLTLGGSIMRHEMDYEAPARFDWKETAPFIFMGGVGLVSFGASMAAFRRAAEQSGSSELTIIGWVLALIGLGCVGVSSINLYRKFGLPGGD